MATGSINKQYFVLLYDRTGQKIDKSYAASSEDLKKFVSLGKGEILEKKKDEKTPNPLAMQRFVITDRPTVYVKCCKNEVEEINEEEALLLLPVCSLTDRLWLLEDKKCLEIGKKLKIGDYVYVNMPTKSQNVKQPVEGIIRYKGPLEPPNYGVQFGVEIMVGYVCIQSKGASLNYYFRCKLSRAI